VRESDDVVKGGYSQARGVKRNHKHEEMGGGGDWLSLGPSMDHWDDDRKLRVGERGRKKLAVAGSCTEDRRDTHFCGGGFLRTLREWMRDFHDRLWQRQRSFFLFILFECISTSKLSLIIWPMYLDFADRILVSWSWT
jgi:hypothetical protein